MNLNPDGYAEALVEERPEPIRLRALFKNHSFFFLLLGSLCSLGAIGAVNFHMKFVFLDAGFKPGSDLDGTWRTASVLILWSSMAGRLVIGYLADRLPKKYVMVATYFMIVATIPLMLMVKPPHTPIIFAATFGFAMGADYMLIPLIAAEEFGVESLGRVMAVILPVNTIAQTWFPYVVSVLREAAGNYSLPMAVVLAVSFIGALAITLMPIRKQVRRVTAETAASVAGPGY